MADTTEIILSGGPCGGKIMHISAAQLKIGSLTCGGTAYVKGRSFKSASGIGNPIGWYYITAAAKRAETAGKQPPTHVSQSWSRWMHALGHVGPDSHNRIRKATARARRIAR